jgi:hypothetical protein
MSEFSDSLALAFDPAFAVFGESCTIDGQPYECIPQALDGGESIRGGMNAGRGKDVTGSILIRDTDWTTIKGLRVAAGQTIKGIRVTLTAGTFRITNDPDTTVVNDTAELVLGPLT